MKTIFKGIFNWYGETHIFYTTTTSLEKAKANMVSKLANKVKRSRSSVNNYLIHQNRYRIDVIERVS